jgi:hypothetical protein
MLGDEDIASMWIFFFLSEYSVLPILVYWSVTTLTKTIMSLAMKDFNSFRIKDLHSRMMLRK